MHREVIMSTYYAGRSHRVQDHLRQEIAFYEARLNEMGEKGDCAYEHALSRAYQVLLKERRQQLAAL